MRDPAKQRSRLEIISRWVVATCSGGLLCWFVVYGVTFLYAVLPYGGVEAADDARSGSLGALDMILLAICGVFLLFGLFVGFAQHWLLTGLFSRLWIKANVAGWMLAFLFFIALFTTLFVVFGRPLEATILGFLVAGLLLGVSTWVAFSAQEKTLGLRGWWLAVTVLGLAIGSRGAYGIVVVFEKNRVIYSVFEPFFVLKAAIIALAGLLPYSVITGLGLVIPSRIGSYKEK